MKKLLTFIVCFMFGLTFVYAYDYTLDISPKNETVNPDDTFFVNVDLKSVNSNMTSENPLKTIDVDFVFDKTVFEITDSTEFILHDDSWELYLVDLNPTYGLEDHNYSDPVTGQKYKLVADTTAQYTASDNAELQENPDDVMHSISFHVYDNAPVGIYKIGINPTYSGDEVTYDGVLVVKVTNENKGTEYLHSCIIDSYNKDNSANKNSEDTLTESEYKSITHFECGYKSDDFFMGEIEKISELYNLTNLVSLKFNPERESLQIENIDLSKFPNLEELVLNAYGINSIDLSKNTKLTDVTLYVNAKNLDFSNNPLLKNLSIYQSQKINLTKNTALEKLYINGESWSSSAKNSAIDLTKNTKLYDISSSSVYKYVTIAENETITIPRILQLPSRMEVTDVTYNVNGKKIKVKDGKITGLKKGEDYVDIDYSYRVRNVNIDEDFEAYYTERLYVKVEKGIVNPKTGVMNFVSILIVMALIGFVSYTAIRYNNTKTSLQ